MDMIPEPGRLSAHALLDAVSAYEFNSDEESNVRAMNIAVATLDEIDGAVVISADGSDHVTLDLSNVVGGSIVSLNWLVERLAHERHVSRHDIIAELREFLDS